MTAAAPAFIETRECVRHYLDEILEFIGEHGQAPTAIDAYTCGSDYAHEAGIDSELFRVVVEGFNHLAEYVKGDELREVATVVLNNMT